MRPSNTLSQNPVFKPESTDLTTDFEVTDRILFTRAAYGSPLEQILPSLNDGTVLHVEPDGLLVQSSDGNKHWITPGQYSIARFMRFLAVSALMCLALPACAPHLGWSVGVGYNKLTGNIGVNFTKLPDTVVIQPQPTPVPESSGKMPIESGSSQP